MNVFRMLKTITLSVLLMAVLGLAACTSADDTNKGVPNTETLPMVDGKYDPPVTITTVAGIGSATEYRPGESTEDNVFTRWVKERLGIEIKYLWKSTLENDAFKTKLMLSLTSGEPLPDIINAHSDLAQELINSGKFMPVDELFEKYAADSWKEAAAQAPDDWLPYLRDGRPYAIPTLDYSMMNDPNMWIRQDWLDNLGLKAPKTMEELEVVMEAFTNGDPDKNGQNDTLALAIALKEDPSLVYTGQPFVRHDWIFGAYGALTSYWDEDENGDLVYGSIRPEIKTALGKLSEWMNKGYIHQEAGLHDAMKAVELFLSGKAGIVVGPTWLNAWPLEDTIANNPEAEYQPYPLPTHNGKTQYKALLNHARVTLINKEMKHPEIFFTYQNYLYDHYANPEIGSEFENGFFEGYDWAVVDGEVTRDLSKIPDGGIDPSIYALAYNGARIPRLQIDTVVELSKGKEAVTPYEKFAKSIFIPMSMKSVATVLESAPYSTANKYLGSPTETMIDRSDLLIKLEQEAFSRIIYGRDPIDAFDKFVADWKRQGGDQITEEVNKWYKENIKK